MNFYASAEYLNVASEVYFRGRQIRIEDVRIGDDVLRLLVVDGKDVVTSLPFLDYHEPLDQNQGDQAGRKHGYAHFVARKRAELAKVDLNAFEDRELAPTVDWTKFARYDDYKAFILSRQRGLIRENERRGRRLADVFGTLQFNMNDEGEDVFEFARKWKSQQLCATGQEDYFADPRNLEYFSVLRQKGLLVSSTLRGDGRLLSVWLGYIHDGVWSGWIFTYDAEFRKYSVGHQLLIAMLQRSYELGHREFDFSIGKEDYKMLYATDVRVLTSIGAIPLSERIVARAKKEVKERHPKLFEMARNLRNEYRSRRLPLQL